MNGDEKEEAHRPRPLSAGIWTLFSWLRRSERSSSNESVSSVGSARTAVSFDFLSPGNCNFTNTPIVLTTPLNPPTETYKRRLQERNLRRQRDRDVTLHRKYGLFREHGNEYDGLTLPSTRWTLGNTVDRPNRERRANSECLQRRAAFVPGKRRAPLPPLIATSSSLPRTYKRKRPAPKPPVKNAFKDIVHQINSPVRMTSNSESKVKLNHDNELANSNGTQKCDKKDTSSRDAKSRTDKNFLKHIFENKKRSSLIETTSVRLLPSISELDKQATEIIESNKLRQKRQNLNAENFNNTQDLTLLYEGNSWFCTSCLRKYNSSVDSCNYCLPNERNSFQTDSIEISSPRTSICTQTKINVENATSSRSSKDEQKILKELLKEMKDSLPKKIKDYKIKNVTEIPTLRIGSTVQDTYKDFTSQPSSSHNIINNTNKIISISSLLSEKQKICDQKKYKIDQYELSSAKSSDPLKKNVHKYEVTTAFENNTDARSTTSICCQTLEQKSCVKDEQKEKTEHINHSLNLLSHNTKNKKLHEITITKVTEDKYLDKTDLKDVDNLKNTSHNQNQLKLLSTKINNNNEIDISNLSGLSKISSNIGHRKHFLKDQMHVETKNNAEHQVATTSASTIITAKSEKGTPMSTNVQFINIPVSRAVTGNSSTVIISHLDNNISEKIQQKSTKYLENIPVQTNIPVETPTEVNISPAKNLKMIDYLPYVESKADRLDNAKTSYDLHTPLKISSLLNPPHIPSLTTVQEFKNMKNDDTSKTCKKEFYRKLNAPEIIDVVKTDSKINTELRAKHTSEIICKNPNLNITVHDHLTEPQVKDTGKKESSSKNVPLNGVLYDQKALPSTSGSTSGVTINLNNNNKDKLDHDRRRHLINQLEQSIAKGDEASAAEAAVKLAKLKLSCSVLSFSSQIVGQISSNNRIDINEKDVLLTNAPSKNKSLEQNIAQYPMVEILDHKDVNTKISENEPVKKLQENKVVSENDTTDLVQSDKSQSIVSQPSSSTQDVMDRIVTIDVWIEDKQAARGPIRLRISRLATMADLRREAEISLGLPTKLQRWIIGRTLCSEDITSIVSLAGPDFRAPFYLCIVQPDQNDKPVTNDVINSHITSNNSNGTNQNGEFYAELMNLEKQSLVSNVEAFECGVCMEECGAGAGVILRECIHSFCKECLSDVVQHSQEPGVACPAMGCSGFLQEREIRTIVTPAEYERWLARSLATAECGTRNAFHCRTRDCTGWAFCDPGVRRFPCPVCMNTNCVQCQVIHEGETCEQYQAKLRETVTAAETNKDDEGTQALLNTLISRGEALECPECKAIITKKWGCDWVKCSACKTEICWVTKGRRWGPGGRGDTSGGCRCGIDGQRCHPSCGYCH